MPVKRHIITGRHYYNVVYTYVIRTTVEGDVAYDDNYYERIPCTRSVFLVINFLHAILRVRRRYCNVERADIAYSAEGIMEKEISLRE